jgi:hypothetical protein
MINTLAKIIISNPLPETQDSFIKNILYIVFGALGGISVLVVVYAGTKYVTSGGDPGKTKEAREQIIYAMVGLMVALSAGTIVSFATKRI